MANKLYDKGRQKFLEGDILWLADNIKVVLLTSAYTYNTAHDFLDDIATAARVATSANLGTKDSTDGVADAADITFSSVSGSEVTQIVIYDDTPATEATKELIAHIDTATGLPVTPNGGDITIQWDSGANKIFKL
jgi:hypothetical protein